MIAQPLNELGTPQMTSSHLKDDVLLFIHVCRQLITVQNKEGLHSCVADPLVAIYERMALDDRVTERGSLFDQVRVQLSATEGLAWLGQGRLQRASVLYAHRTTGLRDDPPVQHKNFVQRQITRHANRR